MSAAARVCTVSCAEHSADCCSFSMAACTALSTHRGGRINVVYLAVIPPGDQRRTSRSARWTAAAMRCCWQMPWSCSGHGATGPPPCSPAAPDDLSPMRMTSSHWPHRTGVCVHLLLQRVHAAMLRARLEGLHSTSHRHQAQTSIIYEQTTASPTHLCILRDGRGACCELHANGLQFISAGLR